MYKQPILTKVPGDTSRGHEKESQGYIKDISKLNKMELLDLKERQELLLKNKSRVSKLPDKGAKIKIFYEHILEQLEIQNNVDRAADLFSELNIAAIGKKSITKMEWNGKYSYRSDDDTVIDSDDELDDQTVDPLKILAQSTHAEKKIVIVKPEQSLITAEDLKDIEEMKQQPVECTSSELIEVDLKQTAQKLSNMLKKRQNASEDNEIFDGHAIYICRKEQNSSVKEKFLPFRTTKTNVHDSEKEKKRFQHHVKTWDNTAATPPSIVNAPAKLLSLEESVRLQSEKNKTLEHAKERYAEERLKRRSDIKAKIIDPVRCDVMPATKEFTAYREASGSEEDSSNEEDNLDYDSETNDN